MRLFDEKFRLNKGKYVFQTLLGGLSVGMALALFNIVQEPIIVASFGASAFIAFSMPHKKISEPRHLVGGYLVGSIVGVALYFLTQLPVQTFGMQQFIYLGACVIAVAAAMFLMAITNTEHAPATSIALGLVINGWTPLIVLKVMIGIVLISLLHALFKKKMMDLM